MRKAIDARLIRAWFALMLWGAFVWGLGSDELSHSETSRFLRPIIDWLFPDLEYRERRTLMYAIRKSAHVIEYAILALFALRALWLSWRDSLFLASVFSVGVVAVMAVADETRQSRSAARTGSGWDVLLDISGGLVAIAGFLIFQKLRGNFAGRGAGRAPQPPKRAP